MSLLLTANDKRKIFTQDAKSQRSVKTLRSEGDMSKLCTVVVCANMEKNIKCTLIVLQSLHSLQLLAWSNCVSIQWALVPEVSGFSGKMLPCLSLEQILKWPHLAHSVSCPIRSVHIGKHLQYCNHNDHILCTSTGPDQDYCVWSCSV